MVRGQNQGVLEVPANPARPGLRPVNLLPWVRGEKSCGHAGGAAWC